MTCKDCGGCYKSFEEEEEILEKEGKEAISKKDTIPEPSAQELVDDAPGLKTEEIEKHDEPTEHVEHPIGDGNLPEDKEDPKVEENPKPPE